MLRSQLRAAVALVCALAVHSFCASAEEIPPAARRAFGGVQPRVSPDGKWIAMSYQGAIARMPSDGGALKVLTHGEGWDIEPAWSPDGKRIAFVSSPNFQSGALRIVAVEDGRLLNPAKPIRAQGPLWWHPDGRHVLGRFGVTGAPDRVAWFDTTTGEIKPVEGFPNTWAVRLRGVFALSLDGRTILFSETADREGEQGGNNGPQVVLWKLAAEGGTPERVVEFPARIYSLCWSADGTGCFVATDIGTSHNDVWFVPLADPLRGMRKITHGQADEDWPSVSADGRWLVNTDNRENTTAIIRRDLATGEERALSAAQFDPGVPSASLKLSVLDVADGLPVTARVSVKHAGGKFFAPPGALYRITAGLGHFTSRGSETLTLPAGRYELRAFRGTEYRMAQAEIELRAGDSREVTLRLERWVNAAAEGWFSGENHIHANYGYGAWYNTPRTIFDLCHGEDLRVCNLVVANSDGDGVFDREFFRGRPDPLSTPSTILYWNQEFRATLWGHMTLFDLRQLVEPAFTGFARTTNPWDVPTNADVAGRAHAQGGVASYTHPSNNIEDFYDQPYSAKGLPVDAALGRIDTLDVMGFTYEPSVPFWYRLLNCGFRLPAAAGTDCFLNRIPMSPPGWGRVYVRVEGDLTYDKWIAGLKAGQSFISNGPMLDFSANETAPGGTLRLGAPGAVRVKGRVRSQFPLTRLEVVVNGEAVARGELSSDQLSGTIDQTVRIQTGGWIALRTTGPARNFWLGRTLSAHTNPVYVEVEGRPQDRKADTAYFLGWIDRLEAQFRQRNRIPPDGLDAVQLQFYAARRVYRAIAEGKTVPRTNRPQGN